MAALLIMVSSGAGAEPRDQSSPDTRRNKVVAGVEKTKKSIVAIKVTKPGEESLASAFSAKHPRIKCKRQIVARPLNETIEPACRFGKAGSALRLRS